MLIFFSQVKNIAINIIIIHSVFTNFKFFVFNFLEFLNPEDQIFLLHTGWLSLNCPFASLLHFLLVVVELNTLVDDTSDPLDVEGDLGEPPGDALTTADTSGYDPEESCSVLIVHVHGLQRPSTVTFTGPTEDSLLVLKSLGTEHSVVETVGEMFSPCFPHCFLQSCVVPQHRHAVLVGDDGHIGLQQSSRSSKLCLAVSLNCGSNSIVDITPGVLVQTGGTVPVLKQSLVKMIIGNNNTNLLIVVGNPPAELHHGDIIVELGILIVGVLVDSLHLYHLFKRSAVPEGVHLDLRKFIIQSELQRKG